MQTIFKLFTLLLISMFAIPVIAVDDGTMPDNSTEIVYVELVNFTDNSTIEDNVDEIVDDFGDEEVTEIIADRIFCGPDGNYLQYLPTEQDMLYFAADSNAQGNSSFEQELIKYDDRIPFDTYSVYTDDGSRYTVDVVYVASDRDDIGYDRLQLYSDRHGVSTVSPTPMAICKPLFIEALDGSWSMKTAVVKDYKIVNSHYGRKIIDTDPEKPEPIVPDEPEDTEPVPHHHVPSEDNDIKNSTIINNTASTVVNITNDCVIDNTSGDQNNNTVEVENVTTGGDVEGDNNIVKYVTVILSNVKDSIINLNIF